MDAISAARTGLITAVQRFDGASANLMNAFTGSSGSPDAAAAVVAQLNARTAFNASLATTRAANRMFKSLLDITV
ncbi:MAG TPA: hypothetical protein VKU90_10490 [Caulobacteraceae bacterium]|nr:hypothetical protein [Caulobacteraceae bacterium]